MLWILIILALIFAFFNGLRDSSSIMAGVISSRALPPRVALNLCGLAELVAPFLFGVAVARSLTTGLVDPHALTLGSITAAIAAALVWTLVAWTQGIPSSSSHALVGGLLGAALIVGGPQAIVTSGLYKVVLPLFLAPVVGSGVGYVLMRVVLLATRDSTPRVNTIFQRLQIVTMISLALSHSANDSQKSMGVITLGLLLAGKIQSFEVLLPVIAACAFAIGLGASSGDWHLMRTLGRKIYIIRPINALVSQVASTSIVLTSAIIGAPVSTSQIVSMALLGSGAAERVSKVRWQVGGDMLVTWVLTIPVTMLIAGLMTKGMILFHF
ncbi:MAG: inorganic phosphate transporter [Chloroflexi bacterium]|nr:inorganic phosphate transporter [Chloroflexota bacterium]